MGSWKTARSCALAAFGFLSTASAARAADGNFAPKLDWSKLCVDGVVARDRLALQLILLRDLAALEREVYRTFLEIAATTGRKPDAMPAQSLLRVEEPCANPALVGASYMCTRDEQTALDTIAQWVEDNLLSGATPAVRPSAPGITTYEYFQGGAAQDLKCVTAPKPEPSKPTRMTLKWENFKIRGYADQLAYPHTSNDAPDGAHSSALYYASEGASISFKYNAAQKSRADTFTGTLGYTFGLLDESRNEGKPYADRSTLSSLELTPYLSVDRQFTTKLTGNPPVVSDTYSANIIHVGTLLAASMVNRELAGRESRFLGQMIVARPDYLFNLQDKSRLATLNLRYIPFVAESVNTRWLIAPNLLNAMIIADVRLNVGAFTRVGVPVDPTLNRDFVRLGSRLGGNLQFLGFGSDYPLDWTATYTDFAPLAGFKRDLGQFQSSVSLTYGKDKLLGLTASYRNGRREDNGQRDQGWSVGLTAKY